MRYIALGDTHGNNEWLSRVILDYTRVTGVNTIVQLGDFGYWEHTVDGELFLERTSSKLVQTGTRLYFLDGNHENHPLLWEKYADDVTPEGFLEIRPNLYYLPRGVRWEWDGVKYLALGGAFSIDKTGRLQDEVTLGRSNVLWWPTEKITDEQVEISSTGGPVDILLSHDAPYGVRFNSRMIDMNLWPDSVENRKRLETVVKAVMPKRVLHGHYHRRNHYVLALVAGADDEGIIWQECLVDGLGWDGDHNTDAWVVVDASADDISVRTYER